jgi:N-acylneuraminate cytidylyltransferase
LIVAIIPARGGSKGIPNKNLQLVNGHPLLAWSISAARAAQKVDRIIVSTDSAEIAKVAMEYGAEVPFLRPPEIADDQSRDLAFLQHALDWFLNNENSVPEYLVQLRPTSPLRTGEILDEAIMKMQNNTSADSLRVVTKAPLTPYKMWFLNDDNRLTPLLNLDNVIEPFNEPRQSLPQVHWQIGTLDVIRSRTILEQNSVSGQNILGMEVPFNWALDIDTVEDLKKASQTIRQAPFIALEKSLNAKK